MKVLQNTLNGDFGRAADAFFLRLERRVAKVEMDRGRGKCRLLHLITKRVVLLTSWL